MITHYVHVSIPVVAPHGEDHARILIDPYLKEMRIVGVKIERIEAVLYSGGVDQTHFIGTRYEHVWFCTKSKKYYFSDEVSDVVGPYVCCADAKIALENYCRINLATRVEVGEIELLKAIYEGNKATGNPVKVAGEHQSMAYSLMLRYALNERDGGYYITAKGIDYVNCRKSS
jgi:hypothetical protein